MSLDIVDRLRDEMLGGRELSRACAEAADEIEQLRKENEMLLLNRPSTGVVDDIAKDRDRWKRIAERLAARIAAEGWTDSWAVIEHADANRD